MYGGGCWVEGEGHTVFCEVRKFSSHATFFTSRWLVGSSSRRMSALRRMARQSASFIFHPPERPDTCDSGFRVQGFEVRVSGLELEERGLGHRVWRVGFGAQGLEGVVEGLGFGEWGFRAWGWV